MTFLSEQQFDEHGNIEVFVKKRKILETYDQQADGTVKGQARIKFEYGNCTRDDVLVVGNLAAAEAMVLDEGVVFPCYGSPPLNHIDADSRLAHLISMAAANIGTFSKRGNGNTIVCHPSLTETVRDCFTKIKTIQQYDEESEDMIDVEAPYFASEPEIIETALASNEQVLVLYRGTDDSDQPLIYVHGEGLLLNNKIAEVHYYGKFVDLP
jgi:hypothetical protein